MQHVNWWLMALAFLLGLVLTLALMIRRVKREVPEYATPAAGAGAAKLKGRASGVDDAATTRVPKIDADDDAATLRVPAVDADARGGAKPGAVAAGAAAAGAAKEGGAAKFADVPAGPHGPGSAKPNADGSGPEGWTVKGNEDSMLYHSSESPAYAITVAEVWFRDVPTAEAAGFNRWDSGKSQRGEK